MEWRDEAIILNVRPHGETSAIVEVMARGRGRHMGRIKGGRSKRWQPVLQTGNRVGLHWWARLSEHLGSFKVETHEFATAHLITQPLKLYVLQTMCAHLRLLPERDPHPELYAGLDLLLNHQDTFMSIDEIFARFEMQLLISLGFGIDLSICAVTGKDDELTYVSPRSGRAVCRRAGLPWQDKLLKLPQFFLNYNLRPASPQALIEAFTLTGFFLERHVWQPRALPPPLMRARYLHHLQKNLTSYLA